ncbi:hypothetical protein LCGC14_1287240 [marine sediment metagenome]|uniref:Uncharacterized protein n=1 Tax=marine sediment metagenome TaxID=412755 RepID=A0A0F9LEE0_9ZZZZ
MEAQDLLGVFAQGAALLFTLTLGIILVIGMRKDGRLTGDEAAKIAIIGGFIYMTVMNGTRDTEWMVFGQGTYLLVLGAVLGLAGIDIAKVKNLLNNGKEKKDS